MNKYRVTMVSGNTFICVGEINLIELMECISDNGAIVITTLDNLDIGLIKENIEYVELITD